MYAQPTADNPSVYAGMPNALTHSAASEYFNTASRISESFYPGQTAYGFFGGQGKTFPSFIMTYAEVSFIKAEAAARGLGGFSAGQAAGFYQDGIRASMEQWGVATADDQCVPRTAGNCLRRAASLDNGRSRFRSGSPCFTDGGQAWFEWRRSVCTDLGQTGTGRHHQHGAATPRVFDYRSVGERCQPLRGGSSSRRG